MNRKITPIQDAYRKHISSQANLTSLAQERIKEIRKEVNALHAEETSLDDMLSRMNH